jgi:hypothetical protein
MMDSIVSSGSDASMVTREGVIVACKTRAVTNLTWGGKDGLLRMEEGELLMAFYPWLDIWKSLNHSAYRNPVIE